MRQNKPSDFNMFCMKVHNASATLLDIEQYIATYEELLKLLFWNHDIDTPLAIEQSEFNSQIQNNGELDG